MRFLIATVGHQDLERHHPARAARLLQQRLADDAFEHEGELGADLALLVGGEHVDDAVDGLRGRVRVQRREGEVTGFRDAERGLDGLQVAHLADEHDVRVLAERRAQRAGEAERVGVHFALVDQAALVLVDVLDRVFDRDDVLAPLGVDLVEHRGQRRRLAGARGTGHQHQPAGPFCQLRDDGRQPEFVELADPLRDEPVDGGHGAALVEHVAAEPADAADAEGEVQLHRLLEALLLGVGADAVDQLLGLGGVHRWQVQALELPVDAHLRRRVGRDVEVRALQIHRRLQQFGQSGHESRSCKRYTARGYRTRQRFPVKESTEPTRRIERTR